MTTSSAENLIGQYLAAYNAFNVEGMLALLTPDVRFENHSGGELTAATNGIDEFRKLAEQSTMLFSEREQCITSLDRKEDVVIAHIAYRGRLKVDIPGGPRAGAVLNLHGESEFSFDGAKISRIVDRS